MATPIASIAQAAHLSGTVIGAALAWPAGATSATLTSLMSDADASNSANQLTLYLAASFDAQGLDFTRLVSQPWQGGFADKNTGGPLKPGLIWSNSQTPTFIRAEIDLPQSLSVGCNASAA